MDSIITSTSAANPNPSQQPVSSQPINQQLTANQAHQLVVANPINVTQANASRTNQIAPQQRNLCDENGDPHKINGEIIDLDDEESRKCEEPKEMPIHNERCNNEQLPQSVCQHSQPLAHNISNEQQNEMVSNINVPQQNRVQEIEYQKIENRIFSSQLEGQQNVEGMKDLQLRIELVVERVGSRIDDFEDDLSDVNGYYDEDLGKQEKQNIMIEQKIARNENGQILGHKLNQQQQHEPNKEQVSNFQHNDIGEINEIKQSQHSQQNQVQQTVNVTQNLPLPQDSQNQLNPTSLMDNSLHEPIIAENSYCETNKGLHIIEEEKNEAAPQNIISIEDNNSPSENPDKNLIIEESEPEKEQNSINEIASCEPHLLQCSQNNVNQICLDIPHIEIHQVNQKNGNENDKILEVNQNYLHIPNISNDRVIQFTISQQNTNQKIQKEHIQLQEHEKGQNKPKQTNETYINLQKQNEENDMKNVKQIKQLLLASLSGQDAETFMLLSDEQILLMFEEIQAESKKEDIKNKSQVNSKPQQFKEIPQQMNSTEQNTRKQEKEDSKDVSKPIVGKQNIHQTQNSPKKEKQQIEVSNNQKAVPTKKNVAKGSSKPLSKNFGENDNLEQCKEGIPQTYQEKNPQRKSGVKKKIVTTIIQQVEEFEDDGRQEQSLGKYRKNQKGESKRVVKKQKMNDLLSKISNLVHQLNVQELQEQSKQ